MVALTINGQSHNIDVDPNTPLLWVIREQAGLTGTKYGCGIAQCGACTVQAPHCAMPQPYFVPVMPMLSRITHSSGVSGSMSTL